MVVNKSISMRSAHLMKALRSQTTRRLFTTAASPFRVCVVGSGPSGFYTAKYLLKEGKAERKEGDIRSIQVDMLEKLPTPFGLVRAGVAPDHPEVKAVQNDFMQVASDVRFQFLGNVNVGPDITLSELRKYYDAVVLAYGAESDRKLGIPGEDLSGVFSARSFVNWYNGHPEFVDLGDDVAAALAGAETVVIVGVGNVALDCARILAKGYEGLKQTDICSQAADVLRRSQRHLKRVMVLGRRGHIQAAFTIKELRELDRITPLAGLRVNAAELEAGRTKESLVQLQSSRARQRIDALLQEIACRKASDKGHMVDVDLRFLLSPVELRPRGESRRIDEIVVERNRLEATVNGLPRAVGTGVQKVIPCGMVLTSVGYKSLPLQDLPPTSFDITKATLVHDKGRILGSPGLYCSGWVKRGATGIIGSNIIDAKETVASLIEDMRSMESKPPKLKLGIEGVNETLRRKGLDTKVVNWMQYMKIDEEESKRGANLGKPREKITSLDEMLAIARSPCPEEFGQKYH